jgi:CHAT domain-containing protein
MRPRPWKIGLGCIVVLTGLVFAARPLRAYWFLRSAENESNRLYAKHRPFLYRWVGAPYGQGQGSGAINCIPVTESEMDALQSTIGKAEELGGSTSQYYRLRGRAHLLSCQPQESIGEYRLALFSHPDDASLQLELGIAFALNGNPKNPLPYEDALEHIEKAGQKANTAEFLYDSALLFEQAQLFLQARERWSEAAAAESIAEWKADSKLHSDARENLVSAHDWEMLALSKPASYLSADEGEQHSGEELALYAATVKWFGEIAQSPNAQKAVQRLGILLLRDHHDDWLVDLLKTESLRGVQSALAELAQAVRLNLKGEYSHAEQFARLAQTNFRASGNRAGMLRAQLEIVYSLDRREDAKACLTALTDLETEANQRKYVWITAQAKLENLSCQARLRTHDIIASREATLDWIHKTGYRGLELRASGFTIEPGVAADSRLKIWSFAQDGMRAFWNTPVPVIRVYAFYYNLANSARNAGHLHAALAILREGTLLMQGSDLNLLRGSLLYPLGQWQMEAGLQKDADLTFAEMEKQFDEVHAGEIARVRLEGAAGYAEALTATGRPGEALHLLKKRTQGMTLPYSDLNPNLRRVLLPAFGNAYLQLGKLQDACQNFLPLITEVRKQMPQVQNHAQRDDALREIESSWRGLTAVELSMHRPTEALAVWETFRSGRNPQIPDFSAPNCDAAAPERSAPLLENRTALVYAFLPTIGLSAWMVKGGNVVDQKQLDATGIKERAERLSALVSDPDSPVDDISTLSADLYQALLKPFAADLPTSGTLIIDPDGELASIPWSVLEKQPHHPLAERFAIAQVIGLLDLEKSAETEAGLERALIFEPPVLSPKLAFDYPFPAYALEEAEALNQLLPNPLLIPPDEANLQRLQTEASRTSLFHFSGHSINNGGFSALLLPHSHGSPSDEQYVTAEQVAKLDLRQMKTVVLASCSSGAGEQYGTVNLDSLTRAFLEAGTQRVIAAGWDVSAARTKELMITFYQQLKDGKSPAEALRLAELQQRQKTQHPYYWAGFQVFGEP